MNLNNMKSLGKEQMDPMDKLKVPRKKKAMPNERGETSASEASSHNASFLKKALAMKGGKC